MSKQTKYTKSARGKDCQIRIPGVCNFNPETTVLAHLNGAGMGCKHSDIHGAYSCAACHDAVDGRFSNYSRWWKPEEVRSMHLEGVIRTQKIMIEDGVLVL